MAAARTSNSNTLLSTTQQRGGVRKIEVKNPKDFATLFEPKANDCILLCYERAELSTALRNEIASALTACIKGHSSSSSTSSSSSPGGGKTPLSASLVDYAEWDCTQYTDAKAQIEKHPGELLLLVVFNHTLADTVRQSIKKEAGGEREGVTAFIATVEAMIGRIAQFKGSKSAASIPARAETVQGTPGPAPNTMRVDIVKLMTLGQNLLTTGQPAYAAKCFERALGVLDAVQGELQSAVSAEREEEEEKANARMVQQGTEGTETAHISTTVVHHAVDDDTPKKGSAAALESSGAASESAAESLDSLLRTTADCLAWAAFAQCVQNQDVLHNAHVDRLEKDPILRSLCEEPLSQGSRILSFKVMCQAAPLSWNSDKHTPKKLRALLETDPHNDEHRSMLVLSLFLTGDLEHALTEAIKLKVRDVDFGRVAVDAMVGFLGPSHPLSTAVGGTAR